MAGTLAQILAIKADLVGGKVKTDQLPESVGGITLNDVKSDADIASALLLKHSNTTDHALGSDNQDLSGLQPKESGKGLSSNDITNNLKTSYDGAVTHTGSTHAPTNAQANADITKAEIEAKLTGEISSHTHAGGSGGLTQQQIEGIL